MPNLRITFNDLIYSGPSAVVYRGEIDTLILTDPVMGASDFRGNPPIPCEWVDVNDPEGTVHTGTMGEVLGLYRAEYQAMLSSFAR